MNNISMIVISLFLLPKISMCETINKSRLEKKLTTSYEKFLSVGFLKLEWPIDSFDSDVIRRGHVKSKENSWEIFWDTNENSPMIGARRGAVTNVVEIGNNLTEYDLFEHFKKRYAQLKKHEDFIKIRTIKDIAIGKLTILDTHKIGDEPGLNVIYLQTFEVPSRTLYIDPAFFFKFDWDKAILTESTSNFIEVYSDKNEKLSDLSINSNGEFKIVPYGPLDKMNKLKIAIDEIRSLPELDSPQSQGRMRKVKKKDPDYVWGVWDILEKKFKYSCEKKDI
jgi:hypothetical protein